MQLAPLRVSDREHAGNECSRDYCETFQVIPSKRLAKPNQLILRLKTLSFSRNSVFAMDQILYIILLIKFFSSFDKSHIEKPII